MHQNIPYEIFVDNYTNNDDTCIICYNSFNDTNSYKTPCNHIMHHHCFKQWFDTNINKNIIPTCPMCRNIIPFMQDNPTTSHIHIDDTDANTDITETTTLILSQNRYNEHYINIMFICTFTAILMFVMFIVFIVGILIQ